MVGPGPTSVLAGGQVEAVDLCGFPIGHHEGAFALVQHQAVRHVHGPRCQRELPQESAIRCKVRQPGITVAVAHEDLPIVCDSHLHGTRTGLQGSTCKLARVTPDPREYT